MGKKLIIVFAIILLAFVVYTLSTVLLVDTIFNKVGIIGYDKILILDLMKVVSLVFLIFGIRRLVYYAGSVSRKLRNKLTGIFYSGLFLLFVPYILLFISDYLPQAHSINQIIVLINSYMINTIVSFLILISGLLLIWKSRDDIYESPVFFSIEGVKDYFSGLNPWGWGFNILFFVMFFGYFFTLIASIGQETPEDAIVTISVAGKLNEDHLYSPTEMLVNENDTVRKIHKIKRDRMLVTMANGTYGWYNIPFMESDKGWNGYLFRSINTSELKVVPERDSKSIPEADKEGFGKKHSKNTDVRINVIQRTSAVHTAWAEISIQDVEAGEEITGWLPFSRLRIHGQMHNDAHYWIWIPLKWVNAKLGDGFFAGLANVIIILAFIPFLAFFTTKFLSTTFRFIPNFILTLFLIIVVLGFSYQFSFTFFDPSAFNWGNWTNDLGYLVYLGIIVLMGIPIVKVLIQNIYESRCPNCKYWEGFVYNRELLSKEKTKRTTTYGYKYASGYFEKTGEKIEILVDEKWKDFCECAVCDNRWTLRRQEHYQT